MAARFRSSIEWRLPAMVFALLLAVIGALAWSAFLEVRRSTESVAIERLKTATSQLAQQNGGEQQRTKSELYRLATNANVLSFFHQDDAATRTALWPAVRAIFHADSSTLAVELLDPAGKVIAASDSSLGLDAEGKVIDDVRAALPNTDSLGIGRLTWHNGMLLYPVVFRLGTGDAPVGFVVQWRVIRPNVRARSQVPTVFDSGSALFIGSVPGIWSDQVDSVVAPPIDTAHLTQMVRYTRAGMGERMAVAAKIEGAPWYLVLEFSRARILAPTQAFVRQIMMVSIAVLVLGLIAASLLSRHITVPLRELTEAADARSTGQYGARAVVRGHDELGRLASAFNSMADHVNAEVQAREVSEAQWRLLFRANPHPMWVVDSASLKFLAVNDAAVEKYGYTADEFSRMTLRDIRSVEEQARLPELISKLGREGGSAGVVPHTRKDGTCIDVQIDANPLTFDGREAHLVLAQDVTERRALETQLRQAQRMEAVGRLAGGIAHDFNNLLLVIMTYTQMAHDRSFDDHAREELSSVLDAAERAQTLTRQLLALSRQQVLQPVVMEPNDTLKNVERLLRRAIGEEIKVVTEFASDVGSVFVDPSQLEQVLLNLAVNARDAMPHGGQLTVGTSSVSLDEAGAAMHGVAIPGQYVVISVADTGIGMTPDVRSRIFDPFFTTKDVGKGTGLGLAIVYGIVTQSGGAITVYSEPGMGSTFRVYFPRVAAENGAKMSGKPDAPVVGSELILLVEDEPAVRVATTRALEHLGYRVVSATNGPDALALMDKHDAIDLVISDVVMPEMNGPTLVGKLRAKQPGLKALLVSGYSSDAVATRGFADTSALFLQKPFALAVLSKRVREALDGQTTTFS